MEQLDILSMFSHPRPDDFAVMNPQVVQNQKYPFLRIFDQRLHEFNEAVCVKRTANHYLAGQVLANAAHL